MPLPEGETKIHAEQLGHMGGETPPGQTAGCHRQARHVPEGTTPGTDGTDDGRICVGSRYLSGCC